MVDGASEVTKMSTQSLAMAVRPRAAEVRLRAGSVLSMRGAEGLWVTSHGGRVWITTSGAPEDVWLDRGDRAVLAGRGLTVIEAETDAELEIAA